MKTVKYPMTAHIVSQARKESGLEQKAFIDKHELNVSQATFSRWETGQQQIPSEKMLAMGVAKAVCFE